MHKKMNEDLPQIQLSSRLQAIADYVPVSQSVIDVGTDHGYIPVYLILSGNAAHVIASDINEEPLENAKRSAEKFGVSSQCEFLLCDGLTGVDAANIDVIIIAGMGGETIASILSAAPWTQRKEVTLILQPMSKAELLRTYLYSACYEIVSERLVQENGIIYPVLKVQGGGTYQDSLDPCMPYLGKISWEDPLLPAYFLTLSSKMQRAIAGLEKSKMQDSISRCQKLQHTYAALLAWYNQHENPANTMQQENVKEGELDVKGM